MTQDELVSTETKRPGYWPPAKNAECALRHDGSHKLYLAHKGWWECAGCRQFYCTDWVLAAQRGEERWLP